jgi:hypothetical protein
VKAPTLEEMDQRYVTRRECQLCGPMMKDAIKALRREITIAVSVSTAIITTFISVLAFIKL